MDYVKTAAGVLVPETKGLVMGRYHVEHVRRGEVIDEFDCDNIVVNEGLNYSLNTTIGGTAAISTWYLGLFSGNYTPVAGDTAAVIATNSTEVTAYTAGARQQFVPAAAAAQSITNSASKATFTFNGTVTVYGAFLISSATVSGTSGTLMSAAQFGTSKSVVNADQLLLTYTFSLASS